MDTLASLIQNNFKPFDINSSVADTLDYLLDLPFSHFPVTENNLLIGCLSVEDLQSFDESKKLSDYRYSLENFFVFSHSLLLDVLPVFSKFHSNFVPIIDTNNNFIGHYELEDCIHLFANNAFLQEPGTVIVLEKNFLEYSISQISQIVESNNAKILGIFVENWSQNTAQIILKITNGPLNNIIQAFRRYEYEVISSHPEDQLINSLKDRSDYLGKYLSM